MEHTFPPLEAEGLVPETVDPVFSKGKQGPLTIQPLQGSVGEQGKKVRYDWNPIEHEGFLRVQRQIVEDEWVPDKKKPKNDQEDPSYGQQPANPEDAEHERQHQ